MLVLRSFQYIKMSSLSWSGETFAETVVFCSGNCFVAITSWPAQKSQECAENDLESVPRGWSKAPEERAQADLKGQ